MGSNIYTRQGDAGQTSLADGTRVPKYAPRVEAYGTIDEANSWIGAALAMTEDPLLQATLSLMQHRLFNCTSNLATPPHASMPRPEVSAADVQFLEQAIDRFEEATGPLTRFVLPGGSPAAGLLNVARAVCRRGERRLVSLAATEPVDPTVMKFVNRASDTLFSAARYANTVAGVGDIPWEADMPLPEEL